VSKKRIRKKHDRQKLIAMIHRFSRGGKPFDEPLKRSDALRREHNRLCRMTMPELLNLGIRIHREWAIRHTPLRRMIPRKAYTGEVVKWRPLVSFGHGS